MYWPQYKVFFVTTLVLFPEKLDGHEVNQWFYRPYFVSKDPDYIGLELEQYRKAGYLKYEKTSALYRISEIDTQKAAADLTEYLKKWQHNELLSLPASKPPDATRQQTLLRNALARVYANNEKEPRVTLQDVYGELGDYTFKPPFWELILSCQLFDKKVKIKYMDYDRRDTGLYDNNIQPFVDLQFTDTEFENAVISYADRVTTDTSAHFARIVLGEDGLVRVVMDDDIKYIVKKLRYEGAPYNFLRYILDNPNRNIDLTEVHDKVKGCKAKSDMTELVRQCGFSETLKVDFFTGTTKLKVRLTQNVNPSLAQLGLLKK